MRALLGLAAAVAAFSLPAQAQLICAPFSSFTENLARNYGEKQHGRGLMANGELLVLLENSATGTWTMFRVRPNGLACFLTAGENWFEEPQGVPVSDPTIPWSQLRWIWRTR